MRARAIAAAMVCICLAAGSAAAQDHDSHQVRIKIVPCNGMTAAPVRTGDLEPDINLLQYSFSSAAVKITVDPGGCASVLFRVCRPHEKSSCMFSGPDSPFLRDRGSVVFTATDT